MKARADQEMIDPATAAAAIAPLLAARQKAAAARDAGATGASTPTPAPAPSRAVVVQAAAPPAPREPLSLDVAKGDDGVFVYTLRDPDSGAVLAVIPWSKAKAQAQGVLLDTKV